MGGGGNGWEVERAVGWKAVIALVAMELCCSSANGCSDQGFLVIGLQRVDGRGMASAISLVLLGCSLESICFLA